jgi:hypothetical protein
VHVSVRRGRRDAARAPCVHGRSRGASPSSTRRPVRRPLRRPFDGRFEVRYIGIDVGFACNDARVDVHVDVHFDDRFDGRLGVGRRGGGARVNALHSDPAPLVTSSAHGAAPPRRWRPRRSGSRGVARAVDAANLGVLSSCLRWRRWRGGQARGKRGAAGTRAEAAQRGMRDSAARIIR